MDFIYRISANSFRGNYSFLELFGQRSQYISIKFPLHKPPENRGNYWREEIIQGQKLYEEIRWICVWNLRKWECSLSWLSPLCPFARGEIKFTYVLHIITQSLDCIWSLDLNQLIFGKPTVLWYTIKTTRIHPYHSRE